MPIFCSDVTLGSGDQLLPPIRHNITPDRVVFCYRQGDRDSREVACHYLDKRKLPAENLIELPCASTHTITDTEYKQTIEQPLIAALAQLETELASDASQFERKIWVIILGYNIPNVFIDDGGSLFAIASRIHRLGHTKQSKFANHIYNRQVFRFFDDTDVREQFITAVIDGPTKESAIRLIDRSLVVDGLPFITGKVFIDPFGDDSTSESRSYRDELITFRDNGALDLGLGIETTIDNDLITNFDPQFNELNEDSFYWGWLTPRFSKDLFANQNQKRAFLYNADGESAANIRLQFDQNGSDPWCNLAINVEPGYATCAGSIDAVNLDSFLRPRGFFRALHEGASVGEAYMNACPFVDWKLMLIGDPLMVTEFTTDVPATPGDSSGGPNGEDKPSIILEGPIVTSDNDEVIRIVKDRIESGLSYGVRQSRLTEETLVANYNSSVISENFHLLRPLVKWRDLKNETTRGLLFSPAIIAWSTFLIKSTGQTVSQWITNNSELVSPSFAERINNDTDQVVLASQIMPEGFWQFTFVYVHPIETAENIHFVLQVAPDKDFGSGLLEFNSLIDTEGWTYELSTNNFVPMISGFPSSFSHKRARFTASSSDYLPVAEEFFMRWDAIHENGESITGFSNPRTVIIKV